MRSSEWRGKKADSSGENRPRNDKGVSRRAEIEGRLGGSRAGIGAATSLPARAVDIDEADHGREAELDTLMLGDAVQRIINVRQVIRGDVADECAVDFVVAQAAVQPAEKHNQLQKKRNRDG